MNLPGVDPTLRLRHRTPGKALRNAASYHVKEFRRLYHIEHMLSQLYRPRTHCFGEFAGLFGAVHDFIVKDGEVESEAESNGVGGGHFFDGFFKRL